MSVVLTMGTFDLLHPGHLYLFEKCRRIAGVGGEVHATINTDRFVEEYKHQAPIQSQEDRRRMVEGIRFVDRVYFLDKQDAKPMIELVEPDFIVIGSDWAPPAKDYHAQLQVTPEWLAERSIAILYLERIEGRSSTLLKEVIRGT